MKKRMPRKQHKSVELEEFQAYGEYTYDYLHQQAKREERAAEPAAYEPVAPIPAVTAQTVKHARKRHNVNVFFKLLALLAALCVVIVVLQETIFRLEVVYVIGNEKKTPQQVVDSSGLVKGRNIFSINESDVRKAIGKDHTLIFVKMQKEYPNVIYLYVEERQTVAVMQWLGIQYTLDADGIVMSEEGTKTPLTGMPIITGFRVSNVNVGQQLMVRSEKQIEAYHAIITELLLQGYTDQVTEINLADPDNIYLIAVEGITIRLGNSQYMHAKIGAVRTDMAYLRQINKNSGILDVSIPEDGKYLPEN